MLRIQSVYCLVVFLLSMGSAFGANKASQPQPGPETTGLRLRLVVNSQISKGGNKFRTRLELINVTKNPIKLSADWPNHMKGDFREYMEGAASIRTYPDITLWGIQVMATRQPAPRAEYTLQAGETLSVEWKTKGRRLKNRVLHPNSNRNPYFPSDGLYSVHAELSFMIETDAAARDRADSSDDEPQVRRQHVLLRSNEQLVPVGGSNRAPKTAIAFVQNVSDDFKMGQISIGKVEGIERGDEFLARTGMAGLWHLTVTEPNVGYSTVSIKLGSFGTGQVPSPRPYEMLKRGDSAGLIPAGVKDMNWMWVHH